MAQQALKTKEEKNVVETKTQMVKKPVQNQNSVVRSTMNHGIYFPSTKDDAWKFAQTFASSVFCPVQYKNKPGDVYLAMAYGAQIGLNPLLAVQNIAMVNGRPSVYGDALTAIVMANPETEKYEDGYKDGGKTAYCKITRNGHTIEREFSEDMARKAGLWEQNTWKKYPQRMLMWRAKGWAIRDLYADVLMGMWSVEEAKDMQPIQDAEYVDISSHAPEEPPKEEQVQEPENHQEEEQASGGEQPDIFSDGGLS